MKLIEFKEQNVIFAKNQPEYLPLPAHVFKGDKEGKIVCCWKLTFSERMKVLFSGLVWHSVLTFGRPLQPQMLLVEKPDIVCEEKDDLPAGCNGCQSTFPCEETCGANPFNGDRK